MNYLGSYFKGDCLRKIALVGLNEITKLSEIEALVKSNANAILFIVPKGPYQKIFNDLVSKIQVFLSQQTIYLPVYFAYENDELKSLYNHLKDDYEKEQRGEKKPTNVNSRKTFMEYINIKETYLHFSLNIKEPKLKKKLNLENIYGFLEAPSQTGTPNPIIALVAHYDSLGVISDLPQGVDSNGSGIVILLELIRILSKLYENYESMLKYDILFALTSAGLHLSRYPREYEVTPNKLYNIFNLTAKNMGIELNYVKKKVFLTEDFVPWEHEQFSKRKIISATLSNLEAPHDNIFTRNLLTDVDMNLDRVKLNIKFIAESLLKFLFDFDNTKYNIFKEDETLVDTKNIETMSNYLKKTSRFPLAIERGSKFNNDLFNYFNSYLQRTKRDGFEFNDFNFYENNSGEIKVYMVKSKIIDLYLLFAILVYLFAIFVYIKGFKGAIQDIKSGFSE